MMNPIKNFVGKVWRKVSRIYLRLKGYSLLSVGETHQELKPYCVQVIPESSVSLPNIQDENNHEVSVYQAYTFKSHETYVWKRPFQNGFISKYGSVVINNKVYCTDWDHRGFEHEFWKSDNRPSKFCKTIIPLLSHHQDMNTYSSLTGYYDFVLLVAAKLSRIKDAIEGEDLQDIVITYPPFGGDYEKEYLELLGFNPDNYVDCREYKITAEKVIFGNCGTWKPNVNQILSLKKNIENRLNISNSTPSAGNRVYISRKGRRVVKNEEELIQLLKEFDFIIIEDKKRSVKEQIEIYRNASFIIGPHGASFSNVIWCKPGTLLYELFPKSWTPDYFLYLSRISNMKYSAYIDDTNPDISKDLFKALHQDIYVSIPKLRASLEKLLLNMNTL